MLKLQNDRYFAAGLVGAVMALYAVSLFSYFSGEGVTVSDLQSAEVAYQAPAVPSQAVSTESTKLRSIMDKVQVGGIAFPLGTQAPAVPGVDCQVSEMNIDFSSYNFRNVPESCSKIFGGE